MAEEAGWSPWAHKEPGMEQLDREVRFASRVQSELVGTREVHMARALACGISIPHYAAGGDYYDLLPLANGHLRIAVADVMGKGFGASMHEIAEAGRLASAAIEALVDRENADHHLRIRNRVERCTLTTSGRIELLAEECVDSQLQAGAVARIDGQLRGSQVVAEQLIDADFVMAGCTLGVEASGQILTRAVQPNATLRVGKDSIRTERFMTAVSLQGSNGKMLIRQKEEVVENV